MNTKNLKLVIDKSYQVFSSYTVLGNMRERACECCVTDEEVKDLLSKPLREIGKEEMYYYMTSAITTFGDETDYKHFLPRIMELIVVSDVLNDFLTFEKLNYTNWKFWNDEEVLVIENFFEALLDSKLGSESFVDIEDIIIVCTRYLGIHKVLEKLEGYLSDDFLRFIVDFKLDAVYLDFEENDLITFNKWLTKTLILEKLETLYLKTEDKTEANRISIAYTILENERN